MFRVETGVYAKPPHGYRKRTGPIRVSVVLPLPEERIALMSDDRDRATVSSLYVPHNLENVVDTDSSNGRRFLLSGEAGSGKSYLILLSL